MPPVNPPPADPGDGISGSGTQLSGSESGNIGMLLGVAFSGIKADALDITTMASPGTANSEAFKNFIAGLMEAGKVTLDSLYHESVMATLMGIVGGAKEDWTIEFPDGSTFVCAGFVDSLGPSAKNGDKIQQAVSLQLSGVPIFTPGPT